MIRRLISRTGVGSVVVAWTDPLHIARRSLRQAISVRAGLAQGRLLDIGCGSKPYRDLFPHISAYVGMDVPGVRRVDVHGDAAQLPFAGAALDTVLCNEVLEHVPEPAAVVAEIARVLRPGGHVLLTTPQTWGLHLEPHDYYRYTTYGLRYLAERSGLDVVEVAPTCGMWATLAQRLADTVFYTYARGWSESMRRVLAIALAPVLLAAWLVDGIFGRVGDTLDNVLVARKPHSATRLIQT